MRFPSLKPKRETLVALAMLLLMLEEAEEEFPLMVKFVQIQIQAVMAAQV